VAVGALEVVESVAFPRRLLPPFSMRRFVGEARWDFGGRDFRNTGAHFVQKLRDAGLGAQSRVLDIGSGCGRIAIPLTAVLDTEGSYAGVELSAPLVRWCSSHITRRFPNFTFVHSDIKSGHYNPAGKCVAGSYRFPFREGTFNLLVATSVFTHLLPEDTEHYLGECTRMLEPGGQLLATFYFADAPVTSSASGLRLASSWGKNAFVADESDPEAAIGLKPNWLLQQASRLGLELVGSIRWGSWTGRGDGYSGQDVAIFRRH
jgi:SAM-dependent methyltransferase